MTDLTTYRSDVGTARLEEDEFIVNDIPLIIPSEQIKINRNSFLNDWSVMRSSGSRKVKSGHSIVSVAFNVPFKGNNSINYRLRPLVAGLRAIPFCTIYNKYLSDELGGLSGQTALGTTTYAQFKPIVLVLNSMTFSTVPGNPETIFGQFQFMWFNYLPYTPIWAYKTGPDLESPGPVWDSELWKMFYKPFLDQTDTVSWPHLDSSVERCLLNYREFSVQWGSNLDALKSAQALVDTIKNNPAVALGTLKNALGEDETTAENALTRTFEKLAKTGIIQKKDIESFKKLKSGTLEKEAADVIYPLLKRVYPYVANIQKTAPAAINENKGHIQSAATELATRYKRASNAANREIVSTWEEIKEFSSEIVFDDKSGAKISAGGYKVYGKKNSLQISTIGDGGIGAGFVLEGMSITFAPSLAIIPMTGHIHPTCQFMGGYETELSFAINAENAKMKDLSRAYDTWEETNLRFRQIPQGVRNLTVDCDFIKLFGIKEFMPKSLETDTIPSQPGRSRATLVLCDAGIESTTQFDDPETLSQEYVSSDPRIRQEVYKVIDKALKDKRDGTGRIEVNADADLRNKQFLDNVVESALRYNELAEKVIKTIRSNWGSPYGRQLINDITNLKQSEAGWIPGLERLQRTIKNIKPSNSDGVWGGIKMALRNRAQLSGNPLHPLTLALGRGGTTQNKTVSDLEQAKKNQVIKDYLSTPAGQVSEDRTGSFYNFLRRMGTQTTMPEGEDNPEALSAKLAARLYEVGFQTYMLQMRDLIDRIIYKLRGGADIPQYNHIKDMIDKSGVNQGKLAYPDFKPQLLSVASYLDAGASAASLINYDPDIFLWYPLLNGSLSNPLTGTIVDEATLAKARQHSLRIFDTAQTGLDDFFKTTYMQRLGKSSDPPVKALKFYSEGKLAQPLYDKEVYKNSLLNPDEGGQSKKIRISVVPDPSKIPTNWHGSSKVDMGCDDSIEHSTDLEDLWGGVQTESGNAEQNREPSQDNKAVVPPSFGSVTVASGSNEKLGVRPLSYQWPMTPSEQQPVKGLVCPVETWTYRGDSQSVAPRDIGAAGIKNTVFWDNRRKKVVTHWRNSSTFLSRAGYYNPSKAPLHPKIRGTAYYNKPVKEWTAVQYLDWKKKTGQKMGYVHQGIDLSVNRKQFLSGVPTKVYALADGIVNFVATKPYLAAGYFIVLYHPSRPNGVAYSRYLHLQAINPALRKGQRVKAGDVIAVVGGSGNRSMYPHLHFETWAEYPQKATSPLLDPLKVGIPWTKTRGNSSRVTPSPQQQQQLSQLSQQPVQTNVTGSATSPLREAVKEFEKKLLKGQAQRAVRAFPTFKLYFIEDDSGQRKRLALDDFFSYNAVQSIRVVKSRKIPADLCVIELTNVSGTLSNRKFQHGPDADKARDKDGKVIHETKALDDPSLAGTADENPIASLMLQTGIDIHVKMGYSSDPNLLGPVFTGKIQSVQFSETDDLVTIVAQSHATELVQDIKGLEKPKKKDTFGLGNWNLMGFGDNATTGRIFEEMLAQPEIIHFGRWERGDSTLGRDLLTNKYQFVPKPQDDNIFAPPPSADLKAFGDGTFFKELAYFIYRTTVWEIFKEMEMRHPNYIGSPVPYSDAKSGERMTYFFGLPNQMYFARSPTPQEQNAQDKMNEAAKDLEAQLETESQKVDSLRNSIKASAALTMKNPKFKILFAGFDPSTVLSAYDKAYHVVYTTSPMGKVLKKTINEIYRKKRLLLAREAGYIRPFRNYHLFTSQNHIIANNIKADSKNVANTIAVIYPKIEVKQSMISGTSISEDKDTFILKLDNALPTEEIRTQFGEFPNVLNIDLAKRYGLSMLVRNIKDIYQGDLVVIGDETIKPYDVAYIFDEYNDMVGPIEVEQVTHTMTREGGYVCEIVPDMLVFASEWSLLGCTEALSIVAEGVLKNVWGKSVVENQKATFAPWTYMISRSASLLGGLTAKKIVNFTQCGQPVVMVPLLHNGKEFTGGVSTRKIPTSLWTTIFGEWHSEAVKSTSAWLEDWGESVGRSIHKMTGGYSVGSFWGGYGQNTLKND